MSRWRKKEKKNRSRYVSESTAHSIALAIDKLCGENYYAGAQLRIPQGGTSQRSLRRLMALDYFFFLSIFWFYPVDQLCGAVVPRSRRKEKESPDSGQVYRSARIDNDSVVRDSIIARRYNELATRLPSAYRVRPRRLFTTDTLREKSTPGETTPYFLSRSFSSERQKLRSSVERESATDSCRKMSRINNEKK